MWDHHAELSLNAENGFELVLLPGALGALNGQSFQRAALRNGDVLSIGAARIQFWLSDPVPRDWRWRERLFWWSLGAIALAQIGLVYWLG